MASRQRIGVLGLIKKILPWAILGALIYVMYTRVNWPTTIATLRLTPSITIAGSVALNLIAAITMPTIHFWAIKGSPKFQSTLAADQINARVLAYSTILPTAVVATYKVVAYQQLFQSTSKSIAFFAIGKICSLLVAIFAIVLVGYASNQIAEVTSQHLNLAIFLASATLVALLLVTLASVASVRRQVLSLARRLLPEKMYDSLSNAKEVVTSRTWMTGLLTQGVAFALTASGASLLAASISPDFPLTAVILGRAVTLLALLAPISVAGIGAREVSYLAVLQLYGIDINEGAALIILLLFTQFVAGAVALIYSITCRRFLGSQH